MKNIVFFGLVCWSCSVHAVLVNDILQAVTGSPFSSEGDQPVPLSYSPNGKFLAVANQASASITMFDAFTFEVIGVFSLSGGAAQSQSLGFHPSSDFVATGNRTGNNVSVFRVAEEGILTEITGSPFATGTGGDPDGLAYSLNGKFLATANRSAANVTVFTVDQETGALTKVGDFLTGGGDPIGLKFSPDNRFLAVAKRGSDEIRIFSVNQQTGVLVLVGDFLTGGDDPRAVAYSPDGTLLASPNVGTDDVSLFSVAQDTGALTLLSLTPSGADSRWLEFHPKLPYLFLINNGIDDGIRVFRFFDNGVLELLQVVRSSSAADGPQVVSVHPLGGLLAFSNVNVDNVSIFTIDQGFSFCARRLFDKYSAACCN